VAPAGSVTTYVVKGISTYAGTQADSAFAPGQAVLRSSQTNEVATVPFGGHQAQVFGTFAPDAGMAAISTNGGAETYVDLYALQRTDNVPLYSTPLLALGKHVLTVRVSGVKASASTGTVVMVKPSLSTAAAARHR
jgi:hypothetical protein